MSDRQLSGWMITAAAGPILSIAGRSDWLGVLVAIPACIFLCFAVRGCSQQTLPRWLCVMECIWLTVFLGGVARESATCWETGGDIPAIPILLILLAAWSSRNGSLPASRIGATLLWLVIPVLGLVMLAGTGDARVHWLRTEPKAPEGVLVGLLLLPCLRTFLPYKSEKSEKWLAWLPGAVALAGSVLLTTTVGKVSAENGFYELSKSITLFGVAERFEALVACVLTLSWFALFSMIFSAIYHLTEKFFAPVAKWSVWFAAAISAATMCILPKDMGWTVIGNLIFWAFLPVATQGLVGRKKDEKK